MKRERLTHLKIFLAIFSLQNIPVPNNLCKFTTREHEFKSSFCTQKTGLNLHFKDTWYAKISLRKKYILFEWKYKRGKKEGSLITKELKPDKYWKIQGVHCDMLESKCNFWAEKLFSQAFFFLKVGRLTFMNI